MLKEEIIVFQLVERYGSYLRCHAPWYDKDKYEYRSLSTLMWFSLMEYAINDNSIKWLDFGGGSLRYLSKDHYKRRYNPQDTRYLIRICSGCNYMYLFDGYLKGKKGLSLKCPDCGLSNALNAKNQLILMSFMVILSIIAFLKRMNNFGQKALLRKH